MKLLIIGGGAIADCNHIPSAISMLGAENIVLAEPTIAQATKLKDKHGLLHVVSDYHEALSDVDACIICTPPHVHNVILKDCIAAHKHVLCEKPLSPSSEETAAILKDAPNDLVIGMCHSYRFFSNRRDIHHKIKDGFFGKDVRITIHEGGAAGWPTVSGYCFRKELVPGGVLYDNGIHTMDFALWCLGTPTDINYTDDWVGGLESNAEMHLTFEKGSADLYFSRTIELSNTIVIEGNGHKAILDVYAGNKYVLDGKDIICTNDGVNQLGNFLNTIEGKEQIMCSADEGLDVIKLLEQCYAQRTNKTITPEPIGNLKGKTVFVTGGTGFIGGQLIEQLVQHEGAKVRALIHTWNKAAYISRFEVEYVQADLLDTQSMIEATKGCDYIMHLAIPGGNGHDEFVANNIKAIDALMAAAKANNIKHVVNMSSVVVHGETVPEDLTADSPLVAYGDTYSDGKLAGEQRFWQLLDKYQLHGSVIRPTYVWGPYSMWYTIHILKQMAKGEFSWVENGSGICNAVYVGNVVDMCIRCCTEPKADHQSFIAADGEPITWREFYGQYMAMIGKNPNDYLSVPVKPSVLRRMRLALRDMLEKNMKKLMDKYEALKPTSPRMALWVYKAPRKVLRHLRNMVMWHIAEKGAVEMAIYSQRTPINVDKNKEVLNFVPRYSVAKGMELTREWLKQTDLYD